MVEAQPISAAQLVTFVSTVLYKTIAAPNARNALLSALEAANIDSSACVAAVIEAEKASGQGTGQQTSHGEPAEKKSKPGRKPKGAGADGEDEEKAKRKRAPSGMNVYMSYMFEVASKDPDNPAYKPAEPVDANGKAIKLPNVNFCGKCWKAMAENDKARFNEMIQPFLTARGEALLAEGGAHLGKVIEAFLSFLKENNLESEMRAIYNRSVEACTGINPSKGPKSGASVVPASPAPISKAPQANGTTEKRKAEKPAKEADAKKIKGSQEPSKRNDESSSAKKAAKQEKKAQEKKAKEEAARKAKEEEQRRRQLEEQKKKAQAAQEDESEEIGESEDEEEEEDDE